MIAPPRQVSAEEGILEATESGIIQEILKLGDKTARDCMTPRVDLFAIPDDLTNEEAMERLRAGRHRRAPVYGETTDDIVGDPGAFGLTTAHFMRPCPGSVTGGKNLYALWRIQMPWSKFWSNFRPK